MSSQSHIDVPTDHDYDGIKEFDNPLPRWWLWTFALTTIFAVFYWLVMHSLPNAKDSFVRYGEAQREYDLIAYATAIDPAAIVAMSKDPSAVQAGKAVFDLRCMSCHADKGQGSVGPNLTDKFWIHGGDTKAIYMSVAGGYPKLGMPEWRAVLEDVDLQRVVAYIESIRGTDVPGKPAQGDPYEVK